MFKHRHSFVLMSALGAALSAGASAVAGAFERVEEAAVTGLLRVTHAITEQVCEFQTVDQLEAFLDAVADRHHWARSDQPAASTAPDAPLAEPMTLDQVVGDTSAPAAAQHVEVDLAKLRASLDAEAAAAPAPTEPTAPAQNPGADVGLPGNDAAPTIEQAPAAAPADNTPAA